MDDKLINIAYKITALGIKTEILDEIAEYFEVDACSVISVKDLDITYIRGSSYFNSHDIDIEKLYKETKDDNILFIKAIKKGMYVTNEYQKDKNAHKLWKDTGIQSACLLKIEAKFNAVIGLESFSNIRIFSNQDMDKLKFLSTFIEKSLESFLLADFLENKINLLDIKQLESDKKEDIKKWLSKHLGSLLEVTHSKAISYVFPSYNIYAFLSKDKQNNFVFFKKTSKVFEMLTYRMYKENLAGPCVFSYDFSREYLECVKNAKENYDVNNILAIPIYKNGSLLSVIGYGYASEYHFSIYDVNLTTMIAKQLTDYIASTKEFSRLKGIITSSEEDIINSFILTIEMRDVYTKGHSQRVAFYSKKIAQALKLKKPLVEQIFVAGLLHDIGKISIPDSVLLKSSKLSEVEYKMIKFHSVLSYEIVNQFRSLEDLKQIAKIVRQHHEKCDGSGYPDGLKCSEISLGARILAIADVFDALVTSRPYREAFEPNEAIRIMQNEKNHFDDRILEEAIDVLLKNYDDAMIVDQGSFIPKAFDEYKKVFAGIDLMTGVLKRETFLNHIDKLLHLYTSFKLYLVDIKNMDLINIRYGREFGDELLIKTVEALSELDEYGIVSLCRFGGDSFMFIVPYSYTAESEEDIDKIDAYLSRLPDIIKFKFQNSEFFPENLEFTIVKVDSSEGTSANELVFIARKYKKSSSV